MEGVEEVEGVEVVETVARTPARRLSAAAADGLETSGEDTTETLVRFGFS